VRALVAELQHSAADQHVLLFLDVGQHEPDWRLGMIARDAVEQLAGEFESWKSAKPGGRGSLTIVCSCGPAESGWVRVPESAAEKTTSVFGYFLARGLQGECNGFGAAEPSEDTILRKQELIGYLTKHVDEWSRAHRGVPQTVTVFSTTADDFEIARVPEQPRAPAAESSEESQAASEPASASDSSKDSPKAAEQAASESSTSSAEKSAAPPAGASTPPTGENAKGDGEQPPQRLIDRYWDAVGRLQNDPQVLAQRPGRLRALHSRMIRAEQYEVLVDGGRGKPPEGEYAQELERIKELIDELSPRSGGASGAPSADDAKKAAEEAEKFEQLLKDLAKPVEKAEAAPTADGTVPPAASAKPKAAESPFANPAERRRFETWLLNRVGDSSGAAATIKGEQLLAVVARLQEPLDDSSATWRTLWQARGALQSLGNAELVPRLAALLYREERGADPTAAPPEASAAIGMEQRRRAQLALEIARRSWLETLQAQSGAGAAAGSIEFQARLDEELGLLLAAAARSFEAYDAMTESLAGAIQVRNSALERIPDYARWAAAVAEYDRAALPGSDAWGARSDSPEAYWDPEQFAPGTLPRDLIELVGRTYRLHATIRDALSKTDASRAEALKEASRSCRESLAAVERRFREELDPALRARELGPAQWHALYRMKSVPWIAPADRRKLRQKLVARGSLAGAPLRANSSSTTPEGAWVAYWGITTLALARADDADAFRTRLPSLWDQFRKFAAARSSSSNSSGGDPSTLRLRARIALSVQQGWKGLADEILPLESVPLGSPQELALRLVDQVDCRLNPRHPRALAAPPRASGDPLAQNPSASLPAADLQLEAGSSKFDSASTAPFTFQVAPRDSAGGWGPPDYEVVLGFDTRLAAVSIGTTTIRPFVPLAIGQNSEVRGTVRRLPGVKEPVVLRFALIERRALIEKGTPAGGEANQQPFAFLQSLQQMEFEPAFPRAGWDVQFLTATDQPVDLVEPAGGTGQGNVIRRRLRLPPLPSPAPGAPVEPISLKARLVIPPDNAETALIVACYALTDQDVPAGEEASYQLREIGAPKEFPLAPDAKSIDLPFAPAAAPAQPGQPAAAPPAQPEKLDVTRGIRFVIRPKSEGAANAAPVAIDVVPRLYRRDSLIKVGVKEGREWPVAAFDAERGRVTVDVQAEDVRFHGVLQPPVVKLQLSSALEAIRASGDAQQLQTAPLPFSDARNNQPAVTGRLAFSVQKPGLEEARDPLEFWLDVGPYPHAFRYQLFRNRVERMAGASVRVVEPADGQVFRFDAEPAAGNPTGGGAASAREEIRIRAAVDFASDSEGNWEIQFEDDDSDGSPLRLASLLNPRKLRGAWREEVRLVQPAGEQWAFETEVADHDWTISAKGLAGNARLVARLSDGEGRNLGEARVGFSIDRDPPRLVVKEPARVEFEPGDDIPVAGTAIDGDSGVASVIVYLDQDGNGEPDAKEQIVEIPVRRGGTEFAQSIPPNDPKRPQAGRHTLLFQAKDRAGRLSPAVKRVVEIQSSPGSPTSKKPGSILVLFDESRSQRLTVTVSGAKLPKPLEQMRKGQAAKVEFADLPPGEYQVTITVNQTGREAFSNKVKVVEGKATEIRAPSSN